MKLFTSVLALFATLVLGVTTFRLAHDRDEWRKIATDQGRTLEEVAEASKIMTERVKVGEEYKVQAHECAKLAHRLVNVAEALQSELQAERRKKL